MNRFLLLASACIFLVPSAYAGDEAAPESYPEDMLKAAEGKIVYEEDPVADHGKPEAEVQTQNETAQHEEIKGEETKDAEIKGEEAKQPLEASASMDNGLEEAGQEQEQEQEPAAGNSHKDAHEEEAQAEDATTENADHADTHHEDAHEGPAHWGYTGEGAADKWGDLDAHYYACKDGLAQSPIDIQEFLRDEDLPAIALAYNSVPLTVVNNGHTVQVNYPEGHTATVGDQVFNLLHFHFHTPSEHYIDGAPYPMEAHFVHKNAAGQLGVFGVMMKVGAANAAIQSIWDHALASASEQTLEEVSIDASNLFPANKAYYKYDGSLTTPPCSEGVHWHVLKEPIEISQEQLVAFQTLFPVNARPVQPLHDRVVKGK